MDKLWNNISREDILKAIELFDNKNDSYPEARNTFLIHNKKRYPAKHIRGLAFQIVNKKEIPKNKFSGGKETADFFKKHGFSIEYNKEVLPLKNVKPIMKENKDIKSSAKKRLNVVTQKNALQKLFQKHFGIIEMEKSFDWLKTPDHNNLPKEYRQIAEVLLNYRNQNGFLKSNYQLLCDIVLHDHKLIIEYDENQHFSKARQITLENYPSRIRLHFPKQTWIAACEKINAKDNSPIDRDEKRAFYDTVRDIEAHKHGYTLIRIKHGDTDWEAPDADKHLKKLLSTKTSVNTYVEHINKHKIARLIITKATQEHPEKTIIKFLKEVYKKQKFEFILTPGGFLQFEFPKEFQHDIDIANAEKQLPIFQLEGSKVIANFFKKLSVNNFKQLQETADFFTIGIDGYNPKNNAQSMELVAVYDLKKSKIIRWTGKFYPTESQKKDLIKVNDLKSHFIKLNLQNVIILGCHDLNVFNPRGQANANPSGWKRKIADKFKWLCKKFKPDIILQHPHTTDSPNIWNHSWLAVEKELPSIKHFASGINYKNYRGALRGDLDHILTKTKKGDVIDFTFNKQ